MSAHCRSTAASGVHSSGSKIQSPGALALPTASGATGQPATLSRPRTRLRAKRIQSTQISFSLARVMATYRIRISSARLSRDRAS